MNESTSARDGGATTASHDEPVLVSLVIPVHDEAEGLAANLPYLLERAATDGVVFEVVVVDDGSRDATASVLAGLAAADPRIRPLHFTRNFGKEAAIVAGLDHAHLDTAMTGKDIDPCPPPQEIEYHLRGHCPGKCGDSFFRNAVIAGKGVNDLLCRIGLQAPADGGKASGKLLQPPQRHTLPYIPEINPRRRPQFRHRPALPQVEAEDGAVRCH